MNVRTTLLVALPLVACGVGARGDESAIVGDAASAYTSGKAQTKTVVVGGTYTDPACNGPVLASATLVLTFDPEPKGGWNLTWRFTDNVPKTLGNQRPENAVRCHVESVDHFTCDAGAAARRACQGLPFAAGQARVVIGAENGVLSAKRSCAPAPIPTCPTAGLSESGQVPFDSAEVIAVEVDEPWPPPAVDLPADGGTSTGEGGPEPSPSSHAPSEPDDDSLPSFADSGCQTVSVGRESTFGGIVIGLALLASARRRRVRRSG